MPPLARAVEPEHTVSRSRTITRPAPSRARWYAVLTPMMPAPTITTSAVSATPPPYGKRRPGSTLKPLEPGRQDGDHGAPPRDAMLGSRGEGGHVEWP